MFTPMQWVQILIAYWVCMIAVFIAFKLRGRGKMRALVLNPSMTYEVKAGKPSKNKVKLGKSWSPSFKPANIFEEKKAFWKFWRNPRRIILVAEKASKAVGWKEDDPKEFSELAYNWTLKEIKAFIKKEVLKARMRGKAMSNSMFFLLLMSNLALLLIVMLGFMRMGVF